MSNLEKEAKISRVEEGKEKSKIEEDNEKTRKESVSAELSTSCYNCKTKATPLWRRTPTGETLCNACGLYHKTYSKMRPIFQKDIDKQPLEPSKDSKGTCPGGGKCNGTGGSSACDGCPTYNQQHYSKKSNQCFNCKTTATPLWRRDDANNVICNACGLYFKMYSRHRPIRSKDTVIKRRKRTRAQPSESTLALNVSLNSDISTSQRSVGKSELESTEINAKVCRKDFPNDPINSIEEFLPNSNPYNSPNQNFNEPTSSSTLDPNAFNAPNYAINYNANYVHPNTINKSYNHTNNPSNKPVSENLIHNPNTFQLPPISSFYSSTSSTLQSNQLLTSDPNYNYSYDKTTENQVQELKKHREEIHKEVHNLKNLLNNSMNLLKQLERKLPNKDVDKK